MAAAYPDLPVSVSFGDPERTAIEALEIALVDLIERLPEEEAAEKSLLTISARNSV